MIRLRGVDRRCRNRCGRLVRIDNGYSYCQGCAELKFGCYYCGSLDLAPGYRPTHVFRMCGSEECANRYKAHVCEIWARFFGEVAASGTETLGINGSRLAGLIGVDLDPSVRVVDAAAMLLIAGEAYRAVAAREDVGGEIVCRPATNRQQEARRVAVRAGQT